MYAMDLFKFLEFLKGLENEIMRNLLERSRKQLQGSISSAASLGEAKKVLEKEGGFVKAAFCSTSREGEACADKLKSDVPGAEVRGELVGEKESVPKNAKCIVCGKDARHLVYLARSY